EIARSVGIAMRSRRTMYRPTSAPHPGTKGGGAVEVIHRATYPSTPGYLDQSAMLYISESQGVGSTPLRVFDLPEVAKVRLTSGMTTTCCRSMSLILTARSLRLAWSTSVLSDEMSASRSLLQ